MEAMSEEVRWYAVKVYYNRMTLLREQLTVDGVEFFIPSMITSLLFVHTTTSYLTQFVDVYHDRLWVYRDLVSNKPSAIPDREMEVFIFVCTAGQQGLSYLGDDKPEYHKGDRVRVTEGQFKGAEGYIKRIKKDRRLIVSIRGVAAVATAYIPPQFLETISK
ncbi:MAG: UpxY family transcription antiterminator [Bacteroidales bacterium]|nr:UpxY family transcription antiterminator [Bacteroidales bacterium]